MEILQISLLILTFLLSFFAFLNTIKYRNKDFQIYLLKEQVETSKQLILLLSDFNEKVNELYNLHVAPYIFKNPIDEIDNLEASFFKMQSEYNPFLKEKTIQFQNMTLLLPNDVIEAVADYMSYMEELFEYEDASDLGDKLLNEWKDKFFDIIDTIRECVAVDQLSEQTKSLLADGWLSGFKRKR
jgi:hypothetical protein